MLGAFGGKGKNMGTTSLLVSENIIIDAGNILTPLGGRAKDIDHLFLTHSHLDHVTDIPSLVDAFFAFRDKPLNVYGLDETISALKKHIFNEDIWPDFTKINFVGSDIPSLKFHIIEPHKCYEIDDVRLQTFPTKHTVPSIGYVIEKENRKLMFTSDTYSTDEIWNILNRDRKIKALIVEVSFTSDLEALAVASLHFTPKILNDELNKLKREDLQIYINHLKPAMKHGIISELSQLPNTKKCVILEDGAVIEF